MKNIIIFCGIAFFVLLFVIFLLWCNCFASSEPNRFLITSILSLTGILFNIIVVVWGFRLGLKFTEEEAKKIRTNKTENLKYVENSLNDNENKCHIRIENKSDYSVNNCKAFISINNLEEDIIQYPEKIKTKGYVFISINNAKKIHQEKISWATKDNDSKNCFSADLCSGDIQDLMIFNIAGKSCIEIPSENGYSTDTGNSRCFLKNHDYEINVRVVSNDTKPKDFAFSYKAINKSLEFYKK